MAADTTPYREQLRPKETDFTDEAVWPSELLKMHIGTLLSEQEFANPRRAGELQHIITQGIGELILRGHAPVPSVEVPHA